MLNGSLGIVNREKSLIGKSNIPHQNDYSLHNSFYISLTLNETQRLGPTVNYLARKWMIPMLSANDIVQEKIQFNKVGIFDH